MLEIKQDPDFTVFDDIYIFVEKVTEKVLKFKKLTFIEARKMTHSNDVCLIFGAYNEQLQKMQQVNYYVENNYFEFNCHAINVKLKRY